MGRKRWPLRKRIDLNITIRRDDLIEVLEGYNEEVRKEDHLRFRDFAFDVEAALADEDQVLEFLETEPKAPHGLAFMVWVLRNLDEGG